MQNRITERKREFRYVGIIITQQAVIVAMQMANKKIKS